MTDSLVISPFQQRVLSTSEDYDIALPGGRGSGKSFVMMLLVLRAVQQYGAGLRALYVRRTHAGCRDFEATCLEWFTRVHGRGVRFNAQEGMFKFTNGATLEINQVESAADIGKFIGRSITLLLVDEAGQWPQPDLIDRLRSNLRGRSGMPLRAVVAANPGDIGAGWIRKRHILPATPWLPYREPQTGRMFVTCPSTYQDNTAIDQAAYLRQLEAATATDSVLASCWIENNWMAPTGAFFSDCFSDANILEAWPNIPSDFDSWLGCDHGTAAPCLVLVGCKSPGARGPDGRWYPRGSVIAVDELAVADPENLNRGLNWPISKTADAIKAMCARWRIRPWGVIDDAAFQMHGHDGGSIADQYARHGVHFRGAGKRDRVSGWNLLRQMMSDAGKPDRPGLYIARNCSYLLDTLPILARDKKRVEDLDSQQADHGADALRYLIGYRKRTASQATISDLLSLH